MKRLPAWYKVGLLSCFLIVLTGIILPPPGALDGSIVAAVGLLIAGLFLGLLPDLIHSGTDVKVTKGDLSVEIDSNSESN